ncbi:hypothetical protein MMC25_001104 [Agyrium rufum]|nr:hypothetical protein [Agyrium rufum]
MGSPGEKIVLISGINGYLPSIVGLSILEHGYILRGTVRSYDRAKALMEGGYKNFASRIEIVEVPDITVAGAFDKAVKGVHAIIHMAAPVINASIKKASDVITPTEQSTRGFLESALKFAGPQLEAFVFTSSAAACITPNATLPHTYNEDSWNTVHPKMYAEHGDEAPLYVAYPVGKARGEMAMWAFRRETRPSFACVSVNGAIATGPPVQLPEDPEKLPLTVLPVYRALTGIKADGPAENIAKIIGAAPYSDARDLATIFRWAFEHPGEADGQRLMGIAGHGSSQAVLDILREAYPERRHIIRKGDPGAGYEPDFSFSKDTIDFDVSRTKSMVGLEWISYRTSILNTAKALEIYL